MRTWVLAFVFVAALTLGAQSTDAGWLGSWAGDWAGGSGGGAIKLKLAQADGKWSAESSFMIGDAEVPAKVKSVKIDGDALEVIDEFDLQGNILSSKLTGTKSGSTINGKYSTTADGNEVDSGTWKVTLKK